MNIVKLKDIIMPNEYSMSEFFNKELKGKYAYWIKMRYIFALDSLDYSDYIKYEQYDEIDFVADTSIKYIDLYSEESCMIDFVKEYIDLHATEDANSNYKFVISNKYSTDYDVEISKLRIFRTWLANELIELNKDICEDHLGKFTYEQKHMLEFYQKGMYDEVLKHLEMFGNTSSIGVINNTSSCCCNNISTSFNEITTDSCNIKTIYTTNMHNLMVKTFKDPNFWINIDTNFIKLFKKYIDNIISIGLTITTNTTTNPFVDCPCNNNSSNTESILKKLSEALNYIINDEYSRKMNFIHDALYNWAEYLYDKMYWEVK